MIKYGYKSTNLSFFLNKKTNYLKNSFIFNQKQLHNISLMNFSKEINKDKLANLNNNNKKAVSAEQFFDIEITKPEVFYLNTIITQFKFYGKVEKNSLILDNVLQQKIKNNKEDYIELYTSNDKFYKIIFLKGLILILSASLLVIFVLRNEIVNSIWLKLFFLILSLALFAISNTYKKLNVASYVSKISINKDLKTVKIKKFFSFKNKEKSYSINDIYLGYIPEQSKDIINFYAKNHECLLPLENTVKFNEELLPIVLRGYNTKF